MRVWGVSGNTWVLLIMENKREDMYNDGLEAICAIIHFPFVFAWDIRVQSRFSHDDRPASLHMSRRLGFLHGCMFVDVQIFLSIACET